MEPDGSLHALDGGSDEPGSHAAAENAKASATGTRRRRDVITARTYALKERMGTLDQSCSAVARSIVGAMATRTSRPSHEINAF